MRIATKALSALVLSLCFAANSEAADAAKVQAAMDAQKDCQNFVRFDEQFLYLGFGPYMAGVESPRSPIPAVINVVSLDQPEKSNYIRTLDGAVDAVRVGDSLWVLTFAGLEEYSIASNERIGSYRTTKLDRVQYYREHATGMIVHNNQLLISQGRLGLAVFDLGQREVVAEYPLVQGQLPLESQAVGIAKHGNHAVILMDSATLTNPDEKSPFRGFVLVDLETKKVVKEVDGLGNGPEALNVVGDTAYVSFGHAIWDYDLANLPTRLKRDTTPTMRFPDNGAPMGRPVYESGSIYTCYRVRKPEGGVSGRILRTLSQEILND